MARFTYRRRRFNRSNYRPYTRKVSPRRYRKPYSYRRGPIRRRVLQQAGNVVKYTCKNNVNTLCVYPVANTHLSVPPITWTKVPLSINGLAHANRQFFRNMQDYAYVKFNYIAVKITDACHIGVQVPGQYGTLPEYITAGVTSLLGSIPVNINWDVEQDFSNILTAEGGVDPEGFAQHPGTKTMRPGQRKPLSFVWKFPSNYRHFLSTDKVKNASGLDSDISTFMQNTMGVYYVRAPANMFYSIPNWWSTLLPSVDNPGAALRTYIRAYYYLGVTFRGRRLMDGGTCSMKECKAPIKMETIQPVLPGDYEHLNKKTKLF
ncbi:putative capsid protein [Caerostris darwini]|uniref:Capsid protein n=1 Tax=Caerostris darwini TaxID=1538125 RepID=A0AAV4UR14_9ARAC|nr:putative capsid protein [Caerostris darwini]